MRNTQVFLGCTNFYQHIIYDFGKLAGLLTLIFRITKLAKNLQFDTAKEGEIDSKTNFISRSTKNLLLSISIADNTKIAEGSSSSDDKTVKKSPLSKKLNIPTRYFTFLYFKKR